MDDHPRSPRAAAVTVLEDPAPCGGPRIRRSSSPRTSSASRTARRTATATTADPAPPRPPPSPPSYAPSPTTSTADLDGSNSTEPLSTFPARVTPFFSTRADFCGLDRFAAECEQDRCRESPPGPGFTGPEPGDTAAPPRARRTERRGRRTRPPSPLGWTPAGVDRRQPVSLRALVQETRYQGRAMQLGGGVSDGFPRRPLSS